MLKPLLRSLYRSLRFPFDYFRARKISNHYAAHRRRAQDCFASTENSAEPRVKSLTEVRVHILYPGVKDNLIDLPSNYLALVSRMHRDIQDSFEETHNCLFFPKLKLESMPRYTRDIAAISNGEVIAVQLKDYLHVDGLQDLCSLIVPELERKVYCSYVIVDKIYIYRSLVSRQPAQVSWMWHYDNHPNEILKIMIYLTDVDNESGPFEYLRSIQSHGAALMSPRPLFENTRVPPKTVKRYLLNGHECHKVTGPRGTMILFDNNIVHRANLAKSRSRDVLVLQIRPATFCPKPYIHPQWTGSFEHVDFNLNPYDYQPREKPRMLSG